MEPAIETPKRFEQKSATSLLIGFLSKVTDYATITYRQLSEIAHCDVQHQNRHLLVTALNRVERDQKKVFVVKLDVGIKLATDAEISALGESANRCVHNKSRRTLMTMGLVDLSKLTNQQKLEYVVSSAQLGLYEQASRTISQRRLLAVAERNPKLPGPNDLIKLMDIDRM